MLSDFINDHFMLFWFLICLVLLSPLLITSYRRDKAERRKFALKKQDELEYEAWKKVRGL